MWPNREIESRIEKIERSHSSLEARLISLTTLIRSRFENNPDSRDFSEVISRMQRLEEESFRPLKKISEIDQRLQKIEANLPIEDFQKSLDTTHEKIQLCMDELKESIRRKEKEFSEKIFGELSSFKQKIEIGRKIGNLPPRKKSDEIENIIRELQDRLDRKSVTPKKSRSGSFSVLKNNSAGRQKKNKIKAKRPSKVHFAN